MTLLRSAFRSLIRTPLVTLVVVLSLGLGIGSNTAIFSLMHQIMLKPLPVPEPGELVLVHSPPDFKSGRISTNDAGDQGYAFSYPAFRELEGAGDGAIELAAFRSLGANLATDAGTTSGEMLVVSGAYFPALGISPRLGRFITGQDDVHGAGNPVVVISYGYWQDQLGGDPGVIDESIKVNGQPFTVVGVAPPAFTGLTLGHTPDVYVPLAFKPRLTPGWDGTDRYNDYWLYLFGRLGPGSTPERAAASLNGPYSGIVAEQAAGMEERDEEYRERFAASRLDLEPGRRGSSGFREGAREPLWILMAATVLVLMIAMANATNLLLARSAMRRRELGVRVALGAGRRHLMIQLLTEALLLALAGGAVGLLLGWWTLSMIVGWIGGGGMSVYFLTTRLQWPVLLFGLGVVTLAGHLLGLYPAWEASRRDVIESLGDGSGRGSAGRGPARVRRALVAAQVVISIVLLVPTGLFTRSLLNLLEVDLGMPIDDLITFRVAPDQNGYSQQRIRELYDRMTVELETVPGVTAVTSGVVPLISGNNWVSTLTVEGFEGGPDIDSNSSLNMVAPGFFTDLQIPLLAGRDFAPTDEAGAPRVAVVNEAFADHFFEGRNPVGRRFGQGWGDAVELDTEIVGLVPDTRYSSVRADPPRLFYLPWAQISTLNDMAFYVRSALPAGETIVGLRRVMTAIDPDLPLENLRTMPEQVREDLMADRIVMQLSALFAALATLLAMIGLYGVMAYSVARRVREIGIRMALGADRTRIRSLVMRDLLRLLAIGLVIGIPLALAVSKVAESQLFGVTAFDAPVLAAAVALLALASLAAGIIPGHRATRVDPVASLRQE